MQIVTIITGEEVLLVLEEINVTQIWGNVTYYVQIYFRA